MEETSIRIHALPHEAPDADLKGRVIAQKRQRMRKNNRQASLGRLALLAALLGLWEFGSGRFLDAFFVSSPSAILRALYDNLVHKDLLRHVQITVWETLAGYVLGAGAAVLLALLIGLTDRYYRILEPFIIAVNGIPRIAIAPLFIMWLGIGITPKIVIAALMVFFIVFMNTITGIRSVNANLIHITQLMGGTRLQLIGKVILPSSMPYILTSLKIVVPMAMTGAIVGEFISSQRGLGFFISRATATMDITSAFTGILVLMVVLLIMNSLVSWAERKLTRWQPQHSLRSDM
ncbi:ABC transporter permease [Paenibacillus sp. S150]|uniref:ABC transporter permease n=1 Tax=Paenibacillus sp. S150 TaxID=2749826 RepID=UPI001C576FF8|nr:ABC transporter permease [Paenibacillus sp. S150]MBW4081999.1 ABC transporter permease [Paenibacillus sp. S150]